MQNQEKVLETYKPKGSFEIDGHKQIQLGDKKISLYDDYFFVYPDASEKLVIQFSSYSRITFWKDWGRAKKEKILLRLEQDEKSGEWKIKEMNYKDEL